MSAVPPPYASPDPDRLTAGALPFLEALVAALRPPRRQPEAAIGRVQALILDLRTRPALRSATKQALAELFAQRRGVLLFATTGIYPETGLAAELTRRAAHRLLPEAPDEHQLRDVFARLFRRADLPWLEAVPSEEWLTLWRVLDFDAADAAMLSPLYGQLLEALRVVGHRIAASGLEPEMLRLDPGLELHASPFLAQCEEALALAARLEHAERTGEPPDDRDGDDLHYQVLLDQCMQTIELVRRRARQQGASFHLTFRLRRLRQHLERARRLATLAVAWVSGEADATRRQGVELVRELALAECRRNDLLPFWRENLELVALRISENAGRAGGHYISESRAEYFALLRAALGGGLVIALMAANKLWLGGLGLPPLTEVLAFCLNYGLGFVLIHLLGFSVATKQPAMTANAIAAALDASGGRGRDLTPLATLMARTSRSQLAAILGNVALAVPVAMLFALAARLLDGRHFVAPDQALHLLADVDPLTSGALVYAGVAGVCLFLAGLIAGYHDNLCAYNRIPERLARLAWPARLLGRERWLRLTVYVENNLGALAGNFYFGILLGGAAGLGMLLGLPLDIRHIAFSSAYLGYALVGLEFEVAWQIALTAVLGILLIGLVNLLVSFHLALWVGLRARGIRLTQRVGLGRSVWHELRRRPRDFVLPPKESA